MGKLILFTIISALSFTASATPAGLFYLCETTRAHHVEYEVVIDVPQGELGQLNGTIRVSIGRQDISFDPESIMTTNAGEVLAAVGRQGDYVFTKMTSATKSPTENDTVKGSIEFRLHDKSGKIHKGSEAIICRVGGDA